MTTTSQQAILDEAELHCLRVISRGGAGTVLPPECGALVAKGMLQGDDTAGYRLTPAGEHAIHVGTPGSVPGIDT